MKGFYGIPSWVVVKFLAMLFGVALWVFLLIGCGRGNGLAGPAETMPAASKVTTTKKAVIVAYVEGVEDFSEFKLSRSISGQALDFKYGGTIVYGSGRFELPAPGYYVARLGDHQWHSIPVNPGREYHIDFALDGTYTIRLYESPIGIVMERYAEMEDATKSSPTAVVGARRVKVASLMFYVEGNERFYMPRLYLLPTTPNGVFSRVYRNITFTLSHSYMSETQVGSTTGIIVEGSDQILKFEFGKEALIPPKSSFSVLNVYADIASHVTGNDLVAVNNNDRGPFSIWFDGEGESSGEDMGYRGYFTAQRVYIAEHGGLEVWADATLANEPLPSYAERHVLFSRFYVKAIGESVRINGVPTTDVPHASLGVNIPSIFIEAENDTTYWGWTTDIPSGGSIKWEGFHSWVTIPEGQTASILVYAYAKDNVQRVDGYIRVSQDGPPLPVGKFIQVDLREGTGNFQGAVSGHGIYFPGAKGLPRVIGGG